MSINKEIITLMEHFQRKVIKKEIPDDSNIYNIIKGLLNLSEEDSRAIMDFITNVTVEQKDSFQLYEEEYKSEPFRGEISNFLHNIKKPNYLILEETYTKTRSAINVPFKTDLGTDLILYAEKLKITNGYIEIPVGFPGGSIPFLKFKKDIIEDIQTVSKETLNNYIREVIKDCDIFQKGLDIHCCTDLGYGENPEKNVNILYDGVKFLTMVNEYEGYNQNRILEIKDILYLDSLIAILDKCEEGTPLSDVVFEYLLDFPLDEVFKTEDYLFALVDDETYIAIDIRTKKKLSLIENSEQDRQLLKLLNI